MAIVIDDKILKGGTVSEKELLVDIAFLLYDKGIIGLGKAREFCALTLEEFEDEMYKRNISRFSEDSVQEDIATMNKLFPK